jgi:hypothetical protein
LVHTFIWLLSCGHCCNRISRFPGVFCHHLVYR